MSVFVDTSALLALLDAKDRFHPLAADGWRKLLEHSSELVSTGYVLVESFALCQHRLGLEAVRVLHQDIVPMLDIVWVDDSLHGAGVAATLAASRRRLSLVDCTSFEAMRRRGIRRVFTFDRHFLEQGFEPISPL